MVNMWNNIPSNQYTPVEVTLKDCHKHFQHKLKFEEHI